MQVEQKGKEWCDVWDVSSDTDEASCDLDVVVLTDTPPRCGHESTPRISSPQPFNIHFRKRSLQSTSAQNFDPSDKVMGEALEGCLQRAAHRVGTGLWASFERQLCTMYVVDEEKCRCVTLICPVSEICNFTE